MSSQAEILTAPPVLPTAEGVFAQATRGGGYLVVRYGLGVLVSLGNMLVLTWWIGPHSYGVFVTAIGLVAFLASLARAGVDTYLVRRAEAPEPALYEVASTLVLGISLVLVFIAILGAPLLHRWYGTWEFARPYLALLVTVPLAGFTGVPMAQLDRALNFRGIAGIELGGQAAGLVLSLILALSGWGVWAPVCGQIAWQAVTLVATCAYAGFGPRLRIDWQEWRRMLTFGAGLSAAQRAWQLRTLVNPLLVGRLAGAEAVAFVALAIRIAESLGSIRLAAGRLAIAGLSRLRSNRKQFSNALERALFLQVMTLGPLLCCFSLAGPAIVRHITGERWLSSLAVYPFVAAGVLVNSVFNLQASALFVTGRPWLVLRSYLAHVSLLGAGTLVLLPHWGIAAYGWAELLACVAYIVIQMGLARDASISYRRLAPWLVVFLTLLFLPTLRWR